MSRRTNWAGNVAFRAGALHAPTTVDELRRVVTRSRRLRPLGTGHSFSPVADGDGAQVTVARLPRARELDSDRQRVRVEAGATYGDLAAWLHARGWALGNMGSLPHISVGGAVATGTHGSGDRSGCLATSVSGMDLVTADGDLLRLDRGDPRFAGSVVALGALGVVVSLDLDVQPSYDVAQVVYEDLAPDALIGAVDRVLAAATSVSICTDWREPVRFRVWTKQRTDASEDAVLPETLGAVPADGPRHLIAGVSPEHCTEQLGRPGPWHERLPHFRAEFTPSAGDELQSEYLLPRHSAADALTAVAGVGPQLAGAAQVCEIRSVRGDDLWLDPAYGRDSVAVHATWVSDPERALPAVAVLERALQPYAARPHWGKVFSLSPEFVRSSYPRAADFRALARELDPAGTFRNEMLDRYLLD